MTATHTTSTLTPSALRWTERAPTEVDVAIVGGGFSGLVALVHLCRLLPGGRFVLFERLPRPAPGVAYGACDESHLLNVPAGRMGAFPEDAGAFHRWLGDRHPGAYSADDFVPRALFGQYVGELVVQELAQARARVTLARDAVVHVERMPSRIELLLASGRTCVARAVVLAPGLPPSRAPWTRVDHGVARSALAADPWDSHAYDDLAAQDPVLVVGSGLTAIDIVLALRRRGHLGAITMVSRNGRLPLPHSAGGPPMQLPADAFAGGPRGALAALRHAAQERLRAGLGWQGAVDAIRPHVTQVWRSWTPAQRAQFLRLARPLWEIHRHRAPVAVLAEMEALRAAGTLEIIRGEIASLRPRDDGGVDAALRSPGGATVQRRAMRLFNCVGPASSVRDTVDPLLGSLLRGGLASCDAVGLGLCTDEDGRLKSAAGALDERMFLVGALRRGELWESTAVPELRGQAALAARAAAALVARESASSASASGPSAASSPPAAGTPRTAQPEGTT